MSSTYPSPSLNFYKHARLVTIMSIYRLRCMSSGKGVILFTSSVINERFWLLNGFDNACSFESIDSKLWMRFDVITCRDYPAFFFKMNSHTVSVLMSSGFFPSLL